MKEIIKKTLPLEKLKAFYVKYERYLIPGALVLGFITDVLTFRFVNFDLAILALTGHLIFAGLSIAVINFYEDGVWRGKFFGYLRVLAPLVLQYTFGALFSAFVIFYSASGALAASWPFIVVLVFLMIANEIFRKYNTRADIQLIVYFFALFSFANLAVPYLLRDLGPAIFVGSGILSFALLGFLVKLLERKSPRVMSVKRRVTFGMIGVFLAMNVFYFTNLIPPIPLSLKDIGVHYAVERTPTGDYRVISRETSLTERFLPFEKFLVTSRNRTVYVFSAVFAPADMALEVTHQWQYFNPESRNWITRNKVSFPIVGGRDEGFRGYSLSQNIEPGRWRVNVRSEHGQIIGRVRFNVFEAIEDPELFFEIK